MIARSRPFVGPKDQGVLEDPAVRKLDAYGGEISDDVEIDRS